MSHRLYAHYLDVTRYPDYSRRHLRVPSWETFANKIQFASLRGFKLEGDKLVGIADILEMYTKRFGLGRVIWPFFTLYKASNLEELTAEFKKRGLYLFDVWGYVPVFAGSPDNAMSELIPRPGQVAFFERELGDHFLGIDNGEQDGRYNWAGGPQMCPAPLEHRVHYLDHHHYFRRMGDDLGNHMTALVSLTSGHYFAHEGNTILVGAETAQGLPNAQMYYSFLRGAGKQYGVHWFGNASVFNRWGYKNYTVPEVTKGAEGYLTGPEAGSSLALLRRLIWTHVQDNSVLAGYESGWILGEGDGATLSPIGRLQRDAQRVVEDRDRAGVHLTPVALMLDFASGWVPARHLYSRKAYQVWGGVPYGPGDYLMHRVFSLLYPGYEDASYFHDERGFITPTPYGDIADVVFSDAPAWMLAQYAAVVLSGELYGDLDEVAHNLRAYVEGGGRLVLTAANAARLGPELTGVEVGPESVRFESGTQLKVDGKPIREPHAFELRKGSILEDADVVVRCGRVPAVVRRALGRGEVLLLLSPFGINADRLARGPVPVQEEKPLAQPFRLCAHVERVLDGVFGSLAPFSVGEGLASVTSRKGKGEYELLVLNNGLKERPFAITSTLGTLRAVREVTLGDDLTDERGYRPWQHEKADLGRNSEARIAGLAVRLFEVSLRERGTTELPAVKPPPRVERRGIALRGILSLEDAIRERSTFFAHYDTVTVSWRYLADRDRAFLAKEGAWLGRQKLRVIADFSPGLNLYPDLLLVDNVPGHWERSRDLITGVLDKMKEAGAQDALFTLHRHTEGASFTAQQMEESMAGHLRELCEYAGARGITLHLQNHPNRFFPSSAELLRFVAFLGKANVRYALNVGHLLAYRGAGGEREELQAEAGDALELVLLSSPFVDDSELVYDSHLPVVGSPYAAKARALTRKLAGKVLILDALFPDRDAEFAEALALFPAPGRPSASS